MKSIVCFPVCPHKNAEQFILLYSQLNLKPSAVTRTLAKVSCFVLSVTILYGAFDLIVQNVMLYFSVFGDTRQINSKPVYSSKELASCRLD